MAKKKIIVKTTVDLSKNTLLHKISETVKK